MRKIVSNVLVVSLQLIVGGLFLFMLFFDNNKNNRIMVIGNDNLDKMADSVSELFEVDQVVDSNLDKNKEEVLVDVEQKRLEEEARLKAEAEAEAKRLDEEEAKRKAEEEAARQLTDIDINGYISKPTLGFNVTTDNKIYELTDEEFGILAAVVSCEANKNSKDDVLAVMSVILNRADTGRYANGPVGVVSAPYQFECYKGKSIVPSELVANVMNDALNGVRNNDYYSFRSWQTTSYSNNYIVERGNRYS
jgi:competence protein ComGC